MASFYLRQKERRRRTVEQTCKQRRISNLNSWRFSKRQIRTGIPHFSVVIWVSPIILWWLMVDDPDEILCPRCFGAKWTYHGHSNTKKRGRSQIHKCRECGKRWPVAENPLADRRAFFIKTDDDVFKAMAVYALGIPLGEVERLASMVGIKVKSETISKKLHQFLDEKLWGTLEIRLTSQFPITTHDDWIKLRRALEDHRSGKQSLRAYGMSLRARYQEIQGKHEGVELEKRVDSILNIRRAKHFDRLLSLLPDEGVDKP